MIQSKSAFFFIKTTQFNNLILQDIDHVTASDVLVFRQNSVWISSFPYHPNSFPDISTWWKFLETLYYMQWLLHLERLLVSSFNFSRPFFHKSIVPNLAIAYSPKRPLSRSYWILLCLPASGSKSQYVVSWKTGGPATLYWIKSRIIW